MTPPTEGQTPVTGPSRLNASSGRCLKEQHGRQCSACLLNRSHGDAAHDCLNPNRLAASSNGPKGALARCHRLGRPLTPVALSRPLFRFSRLRSLNLSNNHLGQFPLAICDIPTLTEVNLSCNYLLSVPGSVGAMAK